MHDSSQLQSGNSSNPLVDEWVKICDTCGDIGRHDLLTHCNKCTDGAQHTYCMRVKLEKVPPNWTCEECMPNVDVKEDERRENACLDESVVNVQPIFKGVQKSRSLRPRKSRTVGVRSALRGSERRAVLALREPDPNNNPLVHPPKRIKEKSINSIVYPEGTFVSQAKEPESNKGKSKASESVTTQNQSSSGVIVNEKNLLYKRIRGSRRSVVLALRSSDPNNNPLVHPPKRIKEKSINSIVYPEGTFVSQAKEPESNKGKSKASEGVTTQNQSSSGVDVNQESSPYLLRDRSRNLGSEAIVTEENLPNCLHDKCSLLKPSSSNAANSKPKKKLEKVYVLQKHEVGKTPSFHEDRKGKGIINSSSRNGKEKKGSHQDENPRGASTSMKKGRTFDERSQSIDLSRCGWRIVWKSDFPGTSMKS